MEGETVQLTFALPTYNRIKNLQVAVETISRIVKSDKLETNLAISNIASRDGTSDYLNELIETNLFSKNRLFIFNEPKPETNCNFSYLDLAIPAASDWVWIHGDDDFILDPVNCLDVLIPYLYDDSLSFIIVPQAKRTRPGLVTCKGSIQSLADEHGLHDVLGWISQIIVRRSIYKEYAGFHWEKTQLVNTREDVIKQRYSAFPHINFFYEMYAESKAVLILGQLIDEQTHPNEINLQNFTQKNDRAFREGVFFFCERVAAHLKKINKKVPVNFFRYVTKNLVFLMMDMACFPNSADRINHSKPNKDEIYIIQQVVDCINDECFVHSTSILLRLWERQWECASLQEALLLQVNSPIYDFYFTTATATD